MSSCESTTHLGVYVLGAMPEPEAKTLRAHIDTCELCAAELRSLRPIADLLGHAELSPQALASDKLEPAPQTVDRLLERAHAELLEPSPATVVPGPDPVPTNVVPIRPRTSRRTLVAASVLAFGLGVGSVLGTQKIVALNKKLPPHERVDFTNVSLQVPDESPQAWAALGSTPAGTYAWLYVRDFEVGKTYKWWFVKRDGSRVGLGSFRYPRKKATDEFYVCPGHTALNRDDLVAIGATDANGKDILSQPLSKMPIIKS